MRVLVAGAVDEAIRNRAASLGVEVVCEDVSSFHSSEAEVSASFSISQIDGVLAATPQMFCAVARFAGEHGLPSLGAVASGYLSNRRVLRERLAQCDVPQVSFRHAESLNAVVEAANDLAPPFYVLPVNGSAEAESVAEHREDLALAFRRAMKDSGSGGVIIESHALGQVYSLYCSVHHGVGRVAAILEHERARAPFRFSIGLRCPAQLDDSCADALRKLVADAIEALEVDSGLLRVDVVGSGDSFLVLNVDATPAWSWLPVDLVALAGGFDSVDVNLRIAMSQAVDLDAPQGGAAMAWLQPRSGKIVSISGVDQARALEGVVAVEVNVEVGDVLRHAVDLAGRDRVGFVAAVGRNAEEAAVRVDAGLESCRIETTTIA